MKRSIVTAEPGGGDMNLVRMLNGGVMFGNRSKPAELEPEELEPAELEPPAKKAALPKVPCPDCGKLYASAATLRSHVKKVHEAERKAAAKAAALAAQVDRALAFDAEDSSHTETDRILVIKILQGALAGKKAAAQAEEANAGSTAEKLKSIITKGLRSHASSWTNSMKTGRYKLRFSTITTEAVFRALVSGKDITGGAKLTVKCDLEALLGSSLSKSFRYSYCSVLGDEQLTFTKSSGELTVSCRFGC